MSDGEISFRRVTRADFGLLARWLAEPHVHRWWNHDHDADAIERDFGDAIDGREPGEDHLASVDGVPVGLIQFCHFLDYPDYVAEMADVYPVGDGAVSIDYFIGDPARIGQGLGTRIARAFVDRIWIEEPRATHVVVPVNSANVASWKMLQAAGFRTVARGELDPDTPGDGRMHEILRFDRPDGTAPGDAGNAVQSPP